MKYHKYFNFLKNNLKKKTFLAYRPCKKHAMDWIWLGSCNLLTSKGKLKSVTALGNGKCLQFPKVLSSKQKPWEIRVLYVQVSAVYPSECMSL